MLREVALSGQIHKRGDGQHLVLSPALFHQKQVFVPSLSNIMQTRSFVPVIKTCLHAKSDHIRVMRFALMSSQIGRVNISDPAQSWVLSDGKTGLASDAACRDSIGAALHLTVCYMISSCHKISSSTRLTSTNGRMSHTASQHLFLTPAR